MRRALALAVLLGVAVLLVVWLWPTPAGQPETVPGRGTERAAVSAGEDRGDAKQARRAPADERVALLRQAAQLLEADLDEADPVGKLRLEGQVLDEGGLPVNGATVRMSSRPPRFAETEADGGFFFDELLPQRYRLTARHDGRVAGPVLHRLSETSDPAILHLAAGAVVAVTVVNAETREPLADAEVTLRQSGELRETTDADGVARFDGVVPGTVLVKAQADGFAPTRHPVSVPEGAREPVRVLMGLSAGAPIEGRVVDQAGAPIEGARVLALDEGGAIQLMSVRHDDVRSDDDGRFEIPAVKAGRWRVTAWHEQYATGSAEPVRTDGERALGGVIVRLAEGGRVAGRVENAAGEPVPYADVRLLAVEGEPFLGPTGGRRSSETRADGEGRFDKAGLPRVQFELLAHGDEGVSPPLAVDLRSGEATGLVLRLTEGGAIRGVVVDAAGEPLPEVHVVAFSDIFAEGSTRNMELRGVATDTTDGGGRFELRGLLDGSYRLNASRSGLGQANYFGAKVKARPGDHNVRLVLERDGALAGRVAFDDGGHPSSFVVTVGLPPGRAMQSDDGSFRLDKVPPGTIDVGISGEGFSETFVRNVEVEGGQTTDMGLVTVARGRTLRGMVVDELGAPVANARVALGRSLVGDGSRLVIDLGALVQQQMGLREVRTDPAGRFRFAGLASEPLVVAAEVGGEGRSLAVLVPVDDPGPEVELVLRPFGGVRGTVRANGDPQRGAQVVASAPGVAQQQLLVRSGDNGDYRFDKLPAGTHRIMAVLAQGDGLGGKSEGQLVTVSAGEFATVDFDFSTGSLALTVQVLGEDGATIDAAQVLVSPGELQATTAAELNQAVLSAGGGLMSGFWLPAKPASFQGLSAGAYTVCVVPINGDMSDPTFLRRLQQAGQQMRVYCSAHELPATPVEQTLTLTTPPMAPLQLDPPAARNPKGE